MDHVKDSDALLLFLSKEVLLRPWSVAPDLRIASLISLERYPRERRCLIELDTAITNGVPIVALNCIGKKYDFAGSVDFMLHLETSLETLNPGALETLRINGVDPLRLAHKLHSVIPNIIAIPFNTSASNNAAKATMADLVKAVRKAKPVATTECIEDWLANRKAKESDALEQALDTGTIRGTQRGRMLQKLVRGEELAAENRKLKEDLKTLSAEKDRQITELTNRITELTDKLLSMM